MTPEEFARQLEGQGLPPEIYDAADVVYLQTPRIAATCSHGVPVGVPCVECQLRVKEMAPMPPPRFRLRVFLSRLLGRIYAMGLER